MACYLSSSSEPECFLLSSSLPSLASDPRVLLCAVSQEHKVLLTGTPLQNTVEELFSLLHFLEPAQFPSETEFLREFGDLKTEEQVCRMHSYGTQDMDSHTSVHSELVK